MLPFFSKVTTKSKRFNVGGWMVKLFPPLQSPFIDKELVNSNVPNQPICLHNLLSL